MEDEDRQYLMSRTGAPGGSMEQLINMVHEGNVNSLQPYRPPAHDYNYDGYKAKYSEPDQSKGQHLTDEFKLPNHITFSEDSKYSTPENKGGKWKQEGAGKWHFYASPHNLKNTSAEGLKDYFQRNEPDAELHLP